MLQDKVIDIVTIELVGNREPVIENYTKMLVCVVSCCLKGVTGLLLFSCSGGLTY